MWDHRLFFLFFLFLFLFFFFFHLTYSRWTSSLPSCLWSQRIFPSLPGPRLTIFLSRCKFSTLTTRQPMVEFYLLTFPRFPLRKKEHKSYFGKNRTHDFRTSRCAAYLLDHSGDECEDKTSSWHLIGFPDGSNTGSSIPSCQGETHRCTVRCVVCVCCYPVYSGRKKPAGATQEEGPTGFLRLPSAVLASVFIARKIELSFRSSTVESNVVYLVPPMN